MKKIVLIAALFIISMVGTSLAAQSSVNAQTDDWPTFMHDWRRTGIAGTSLPSELTLIWKYEIQGASIFSSPAVARGKVYFSVRENYGKGENERLWIYALNAENGELVWKFKTNRGGGQFLDPSPTIVDNRVYVGSWDNHIYALDAETGELMWRFNVYRRYGLAGVDGAPVIIDSRLYIGTWNGYLFCLNADNSDLIWEYSYGNGIMGHVIGSPTVVAGVVYFGTGAGVEWPETTTGFVYALNANDGSLIWKFHIGDEISASPVVVDNIVYITAGWMGDLPGDGVYALSAENGGLIWYYDSQNWSVSSTLVMDGKVFFTSRNFLYALNMADGALMWKTDLEWGTHSSPVGADNKVLVGGDGLYVVDSSTGVILQHFKTNHIVDSTPAIAYGNVYFGSVEGKFYALGAPKSPPGTGILELLQWPLILLCIASILGGIAVLVKRSRAGAPEF